MGGLIAIDPGYAVSGQGCACAYFSDRKLVSVWYARPEEYPGLEYDDVERVVWECPQVDSRTRVSTPQVVQLAATGASLAGLYAGTSGARLEAVSPSSWKGHAAKPVSHAGVWRALDERERSILGGVETYVMIQAALRRGAMDRWSRKGASYYVGSGAGVHNILDAVGIGLWALRRS